MTKSEKKLLVIFISLCLTIGFTFCLLSLADRGYSADKRIRQYEAASAKIPQENGDVKTLEKELQSLRTSDLDSRFMSPLTANELIGSVRDGLSRQGIIPTRLQITGKDGGESVEFTITCDPESFLKFLESHSRGKTGIGYESLTIRKTRDGDKIEIGMRITNER